MKIIGFIANMDRDENLQICRRLISFVLSKGAEVAVAPNIAPKLLDMQVKLLSVEIWDSVEFVVVLGGDGTMLKAAQSAAYAKVPLIGINLGNLGYLTDADKDTAESSIADALEGRSCIESRMMLAGSINGSEPKIALNDIVLHRTNSLRLIECKLWINGIYTHDYLADGIIIASPTGSTAYNLSAGGPILKPDARMMALTPICPHSLSSRTVIVSHDDSVCLQFKKTEGISIFFDSEEFMPNIHQDLEYIEIVINASKYTTDIIKTHNFGFFDVLREKLMTR